MEDGCSSFRFRNLRQIIGARYISLVISVLLDCDDYGYNPTVAAYIWSLCQLVAFQALLQVPYPLKIAEIHICRGQSLTWHSARVV